MFPSRRRPKTIRSIPPQQARAKTNPNGPPASKRRIWANQCIAGFIRACDRPPLLKNRKCATSAQTRWACPQGTLLKEQSQPRDNDLNPGFWMTSYSSRTKNMTCFAAAATASYSPLFTACQQAPKRSLWSPAIRAHGCVSFFSGPGKTGCHTAGCGSNPPSRSTRVAQPGRAAVSIHHCSWSAYFFNRNPNPQPRRQYGKPHP